MSKKRNAALWAIAAAALALRLVLAAAQLPYHYQADEFQIVERALRVGAGEFNPGLFTWPGTLVIYLNFLAFACYFAVAKVAGVAASAAAFADHYWREPGLFYFIGRAISSAFGVLAVSMAWRWARESFGKAAGLTAAAFVALAPAAVKASAVALPDMAAAALGAASLAYAVHFVREPKLRHFALAGFFLGMAAAAKYHVLLYAPALIACPFLAGGGAPGKAKTLAVGVGATVAAFLIACPFALLDAPTFTSDILSMARRPGMVRWLPSPLYVFGTTFPLTLGWPLLIMTVFGVVSLIRRRDKFALVVGLAAAPFVVAALIRPLPPRHLLPLVAPLAVAAGAFFVDAVNYNAKRAYWVFGIVFSVALTIVISHVVWAWREDTRTAAARWLDAEVPPDTPVIIETLPPDADGPPLWPSKAAIERLLAYYAATGGGSPGRYGYFLKDPHYPFGFKTHDTYIVANMRDYDKAPRPAYAVLVIPDDRDFYAEQGKPYKVDLTTWGEKYHLFLNYEGRLVKSFSGFGRPGPWVEIYELK